MTDSVPEDRRRTRQETADERSPDNVAPMVAYLAGEASDWLTGRVIGAGGYEVSLWSNPEPIRQITTTGPWDLDQLTGLIERTFRPAVAGPSQTAATQ